MYAGPIPRLVSEALFRMLEIPVLSGVAAIVIIRSGESMMLRCAVILFTVTVVSFIPQPGNAAPRTTDVQRTLRSLFSPNATPQDRPTLKIDFAKPLVPVVRGSSSHAR